MLVNLAEFFLCMTVSRLNSCWEVQTETSFDGRCSRFPFHDFAPTPPSPRAEELCGKHFSTGFDNRPASL